MAHLRQVSLTEDTEDHCFVCDYPAETLEELQFHLQTFHPQQDLSTIYVCEQCEEHFKTQEDTVCHLKTCRSDPKPTVEEELAEFVEMAKPEDHHYAAEEKETGTTKGKTRMEPKKLIVRQDEPVENEFVRKLREEVSKEIEMEKTDKLINRILKKPPPFKNRIQNNPSPLQKEKAVKESIKNKPVPFSKVSRIFHFFNTKSVEEIKQGYRCPDCGNTCKTYVSAKKHLLEHCNKEPDKCCEFCDYKTKLNTNLKRHIKLVHAAPDLYVCDKCGKDFKKKQLFSHHIRYICESREPEKCSQCDFATKIPGILNSHMFKAHGILKVSDPKEVAKQKDFPDPIKVDEGFKCPDCHRIYAVPDNYKKHRLLSCRQVCNAVKCMVESCQFKTNNYYNLRNHMRRVHFLFAKCKNFELFDLVDREEEV